MALFTVIWLVVVTSRCSLQINPLKASQAPGPFTPSYGAIQGPWGGRLSQESLCGSSQSLLPLPRFLQAMVAATSLIQTWQPLLPTCRDMLSAESPAVLATSLEFFTSEDPCPQLCSGLMSWAFRWAENSLPHRTHQVP